MEVLIFLVPLFIVVVVFGLALRVLRGKKDDDWPDGPIGYC